MATDFYNWEIPGKPVRVRLSLPVIERLNAWIIENFRIAPENPPETFGVLLGHSRKDGRMYTVTVTDFEPLEAAPQRLTTIRDLAPVGLFRGRPAGQMKLDADDAAGIERLFDHPDQFYLLVQPQAGAPARAGIFIQEEGSLRGCQTYREFPFHSELLRQTMPGRIGAGALILAATLLVAGGAYYFAGHRNVPQPYATNLGPAPAPAADKPSPSEPLPRKSPPQAPEPLPQPKTTVSTVSFEPIPPGRFSRLFTKLRRAKFTPPRLVATPLLSVPRDLATETPVTLKLRLDKSGRVEQTEILKAPGLPELTRLVTQAAETWRFEPAKVNKKPVASEVLARFHFKHQETP